MRHKGIAIALWLVTASAGLVSGAQVPEPNRDLTTQELEQITTGMKGLQFQVSSEKFSQQLDFLRPFLLNPVLPRWYVCGGRGCYNDIGLAGDYRLRVSLNDNPIRFKTKRERQLADRVHSAELFDRRDKSLLRVESRPEELDKTYADGRQAQAGERKAALILQSYFGASVAGKRVFAEAKAHGVDYRKLLRGAIQKDADSLSEIFRYSGPLPFKNDRDQSEILRQLLRHWGDAPFAQVLSNQSPDVRKWVTYTLDDAWPFPGWSDVEYPETGKLAENVSPESPP